MILIGISGKRGSGKDTLANELVKSYGFIKLSFARLLKQHVREFFDMSLEQTDGFLKETIDLRYNKTPREIMIQVGQFYRAIDPDFWIKGAFKGLDTSKNYVMSDLRFKNEANYIRNVHGAYLVRLNRRSDLNIYGPTGINDISEIDLDDYNFNWTVPASENVDMNDIKRNATKLAEMCIPS